MATVPPSGWDHWFVDFVFAALGGVGACALAFAAFMVRLLFKREMDRLNENLGGIQVAVKEFTSSMQTRMDNHEHRVSRLEGFYFRSDGVYIGPERRKSAQRESTEDE